MAFMSRSRGTELPTSVCRRGLFNAQPAPVKKENACKCQSSHEPQLEDGSEYDSKKGQVELVQEEDDAAVELVGDDSRDGRPEHRQGPQPQHDGHLHR